MICSSVCVFYCLCVFCFRQKTSYEMRIIDWSSDVCSSDLVSYDQLEPYYDRFEYLCGIGGKAGNLGGKTQAGGNPFEGARRRDYPNPPMDMTYAPTLFAKATEELGMPPFPAPSANM